ncbi:hypothetical protein [Candidatus Contubernalis alkaliaceticus]|uniref:hypothetical protein n=1 Tax=Candidatus Contubernalis alkaliaceticus TaxID=338645 RepID=UPI001F4C3B8A|nr:hypothetical protein [Candidatus Contubernalis alkalaceticus]UNC90753.1 hypothetical protein HUE98_00830 [Candidatus Contubernalis alkalaceticus]
MTQEVIDNLTMERDQMLDDLLATGEENREELLEKIIEIDEVIESLKSQGDYLEK